MIENIEPGNGCTYFFFFMILETLREGMIDAFTVGVDDEHFYQ